MAMKIYTKTGDGGTTGLIGGTRVSKASLRIDTYGTVDELNAHIGYCCDQLSDAVSLMDLREVQDRLFTIGASLAADPEKETKLKIPDLHDTDISRLETAIDRMNDSLPPMKFFILPGGHLLVSSLHIARCVCRRAERLAVQLHETGSFVEPKVIQYLNRLSDYLFVLSRYCGHLLQVPEQPWRPRTS